LAVAVNLSGAAKYIDRAFQQRPLPAILLATLVGAFSPFCSCTVIPVIASLLIGGVPLAPVMSFWIASPSMDPEIFFLSVGTLGWELALWRLLGTLALSLGAGLLTHGVRRLGWLNGRILRAQQAPETRSMADLLRDGWRRARQKGAAALAWGDDPRETAVCCPSPSPVLAVSGTAVTAPAGESCALPAAADAGGPSCAAPPRSFRQRLLRETWDATQMVLKFMALAFFLEALIIFYAPEEWIAGLLGGQNLWAIPAAALLGVPVYTSNLTALPLMEGLLAQGMAPGAALAFLVAGPTTTLPAMTAVWGLVERRVFFLYVLISLLGAVGLGGLYALLT
jgi:hypothetical protein